MRGISDILLCNSQYVAILDAEHRYKAELRSRMLGEAFAKLYPVAEEGEEDGTPYLTPDELLVILRKV